MRANLFSALFAASVPIFVLAFVSASAIAQPNAGENGNDALANATPEALIARAEVAEIEGRYSTAKRAREAAIEKLDAQVATLRQSLDRAAAITADGEGADDLAAFSRQWRGYVEGEIARVTAERERCQHWLDELNKPNAGAVPKLDFERRIVWTHERELNAAIAKVREYEAKGRFDRAHAFRRRPLIIAKANLRFYAAKIRSLENTQRLMGRNRQLRGSDIVETFETRIAYFKWVVEYTARWRDRLETAVTAQASAEWNREQAAMWANVPTNAERFGIPRDQFTADRCAEFTARARARAEFYEARANAGDENGDGNGN